MSQSLVIRRPATIVERGIEGKVLWGTVEERMIL